MSNSDSDDDKPILELIKKRRAQAAVESTLQKKQEQSNPTKKIKQEKVESTSSRSANAEKSSRSKSSSSSSYHGSSHFSKSVEYYTDTDKGSMVQKLLCRWWYAITWPKPEDIKAPPAGFESLDGFPGVFIGTKSDCLGEIVDLRDKSTCPNLINLSRWSSADLQATLLKAYENQMELLKTHESETCPLYLRLGSEMKAVKRIDPEKADREGRKFIFVKKDG